MGWFSSLTLLLLLTVASSTRVDSRDVRAAIDSRSLEETSDTAAEVDHVLDPGQGSTIWFGQNKSGAAKSAPQKNGIGKLDVEDGDDLGAMAQMDININILDTVTRLSSTTASIFQLLTVLEAASLGSAASVIGLPVALLGGIVSAWATYKDVEAAKLCMLQNFIEGLAEMLILVSKKRAGVADALEQLKMDLQTMGSSASSSKAKTASLDKEIDALAEWAQVTIQKLCEDPDWAHLQGVVVNVPNFFFFAEEPSYTTFPCEPGPSKDSSHSNVAEAMISSTSSWREVITQASGDEMKLTRMTQYYTEVIRTVNDVMIQFSERLREDGRPWHYDAASAKMARKHMLANSVLGLLTLGPDLFKDVKAAASVGSHLVAVGTHGVSGGLQTKEALGWAQEDKVARLLQVKGVLLELGIDIETDEGRELLDAKVEDVLALLNQDDKQTQSISLHVQTWWLENKMLSDALQPIPEMSHYHVEHKLAFNVLVVPTTAQSAIHDEAVFTTVATHSATPEMEPSAGLEMFCAEPTAAACKKHRKWTAETNNQSTVTAWLFGSTLRTGFDGKVNIRPGDVRIVIVDLTTLKLDAAGLPCTNYLNLGFPILHERLEFEDGWEMCMGLRALVTAGLHIDQDLSDKDVLEYYIDQFAHGTGCTDEMGQTKKTWRKEGSRFSF